jgi:fructosamine-3-kinase
MRQEMETMLPRSVLRDIDHALKRAGEAMAPQGLPSLIHGDVWAGNIVVVRRDDGWHLSGLVDPGPEYADVEQELAYLEVFDTVGPTFFEIYTAQTPRRPGYAFRRLFHWLNTYMVHVWIFGDQGYRDRVASIAAEIARA